jgi:hypothetical protein
MTTRRPLLALAALLLTVGCAPRIIDIRPYAAHPDQKMDGENVVVSWKHGVRVALRYMRDGELDEIFRLPGKNVKMETGNPFISRPPRAPAKFTVFQLDLRNESEYDTFVDAEKILMRDELSGEYKPMNAQSLVDYWIGKVTIELGKPVTWSAQMEAVKRKDIKEKSRRETIYEGGRLPSRGEHAGFLAFRDLPKGSKHLQILIEVVTRSSRYGNPLNVDLFEFNFDRIRIPPPPKDEAELNEWRDH